MEHFENFFTGFNNFKIYYQIFIPDKPKAVIQITHGYWEHSGRYKNLIDFLLNYQMIVYISDDQGHGKSEGKRFFIKNFDDLVKDQYTITKMIKEKFPNLPIFLLGHSMGSLVAQRYAIEHQSEIKGLILSGTGTTGPSLPKSLQIIARILNKIYPAFKVNSGLNPQSISSDPESVKDYVDDPLIMHEYAPVSVGVCFMDHYKQVKNRIGEIRIPILIQKGDHDILMLGEKELFNDLRTDDKTLIYYENSQHEIYTEIKPIRDKAFADLINWIQKHL